MMRTKLIFLTLFSFLISQSNIDFSYEMKYSEGDEETETGLVNPYEYFENFLDVNWSINSHLSLYSQLEYSSPPVLGASYSGLNKIYLEYYLDNLHITLGDLFQLYGYGLSVNTTADQEIDFDNTVRGMSWEYDLCSNTRLFGLFGKGTYQSRSNPAFRFKDRSVDNSIAGSGLNYSSDKNLGDFSLLYVYQKTYIDEQNVSSYYHPSDAASKLEEDLAERISSDEIQSDTLFSKQFSASYRINFSIFDIYLEKMWNRYNKILGDNVDGSMFYGSLMGSLGNIGFTWDYKDYDMLYYIPTISNPPIVFREASSTLIGRQSHSINFNDEIGHQFEINSSFSEYLNFLGNVAFSRRHLGNGISTEYVLNYEEFEDSLDFFFNEDTTIKTVFAKPSFTDILTYDLKQEDYSFFPFRELYAEFNGSLFDGNINWMIGFDQIDDIIKYHNQHEYVNNDDLYTSGALTDSISVYFNDYWWEIWNGFYYQGFCDSACADGIFENPLNYGMPVEEKIVESIDSKIYDVEQLVANNQSQIHYNYQINKSFTIPTNFSFNFGNGSSVNIYWEHQWRNEDIINEYRTLKGDLINDDYTFNTNFYNRFTSLTINFISKISFSVNHDYEYKHRDYYETIEDDETGESVDIKLRAKEKSNWLGYDLTVNIGDQSQLSLFYGSIKGGRICANGICAEQPAFKDGVKITFRSMF